MDHLHADSNLKYFISAKAPYAVITFSGFIDDSTARVIESLIEEMKLKKDLSLIVLQLSEVSRATGEGLRAFTLLQAALRGAPADIRLVGLPLELKEYLIKMGVVRMLEIQSSLDIALLDLKRKSSRTASDPLKKIAG